MAILQRVVLRGFKSIRDTTLELRPLNILVGANGAGKSNLVLFFKMLNKMMGSQLQKFIATSGRAQSLLHFGPKVTPQIEALLHFEDAGMHLYEMRLFFAASDTLVFAQESLGRYFSTVASSPVSDTLGSGHHESRIPQEVANGNLLAESFAGLLNNCRVFHFHDTSPIAPVRQYCYVGDNEQLRHDAGNLAAMLYRYRIQNGGSVYDRIAKTIRMIAPFFDDFELFPSPENDREIILNWRHRKEPSQLFGPHQLSDGTLRAMCLVTLLLQPEDELPNLIVVDEPELGLHPYALNVVASLFKKASHHAQVLVSTQSSSFLDNFEPEDIVVADCNDEESTFRRLNATELETWLEEYSLGEIWEKNIIRGGPH